jgi:hypothetical protein
MTTIYIGNNNGYEETLLHAKEKEHDEKEDKEEL